MALLFEERETADGNVEHIATIYTGPSQKSVIKASMTPNEHDEFDKILQSLRSEASLQQAPDKVDLMAGVTLALIRLHAQNGTGSLDVFNIGTRGYEVLKEAVAYYQSQPSFKVAKKLEDEMSDYLAAIAPLEQWAKKIAARRQQQDQSLQSRQ